MIDRIELDELKKRADAVSLEVSVRENRIDIVLPTGWLHVCDTAKEAWAYIHGYEAGVEEGYLDGK